MDRTALLCDGFIVVGAALVLGGIFGRNFRYGSLEFGGDGPPAPEKSSRIMFCTVGTLFMTGGFLKLFGVL